MAATLLDGVKIANDIKNEVAEEVRRLRETGLRPGLAAVLVGSNPASEIYVRSKVQNCEALGLYSEKITPPESASTEDLLELVHDLNSRDEIDGIRRDRQQHLLGVHLRRQRQLHQDAVDLVAGIQIVHQLQ